MSKLPPRRQPREGHGQVQYDSSHRAFDPYGELEQALAQGRDLGLGAGGAGRAPAQLLEQDVRREREQDPDLVGQKARATGPIHLQPVMQFLEPVLDVAALAVELVDGLRVVPEVGHHEARIVLGRAAGMADDLGLDDHPAPPLPRPSGVPRRPIEVFGLATLSGAYAGLAHQAARPLLQPHVAGHRHDVLDVLPLQDGEQFGARKATVQPDAKHGVGKGGPELMEQPAQEAARPALRGRVAGSEYGRHGKLFGFVVEGHRGHDRQVAPRVVVPVEERELLLTVRGIVGGIEVDRDSRGPALEPPPMVLDHGVGQHVPHRDQCPAAHGVLEALERRLRGEGGARDRIAADHKLVDDVVRQPRGVVAVGVTRREPEHALPDQFEHPMPDFRRLALVVHTRGQALGQPELGVDPPQQDQATVRAGVGDVERGDDRLAFRLESERDLRYTGCGHRASSFECLEAARHRFYSTLEGTGFTGRDVHEGFALAARQWPIDLVFYDNRRDPQRALANCEDAIGRKVDLYIQYNADAGANTAVGRQLRAAGIPVLAVNYPVAEAPLYTLDKPAAGRIAGDALADFGQRVWRGKALLGVLIGHLSPAEEGASQRAQGVSEGLKRRLPALAMVSLDTQGNTARVGELLGRVLTAHAGSKALIAAMDDTTALAAKAALEGTGRLADGAIVGHGVDRSIHGGMSDRKEL